jgi:hypothetical protein
VADPAPCCRLRELRLHQQEDHGIEPEPFYETDVDGSRQIGPIFSPNGEWLAYTSNEETSNYGIYVQPFPPTGVRYPIAEQGGVFAVWSTDGNELFYRRTTGVLVGQNARLMRVNVTTAPRFAFGDESELPIQGFQIVANYRDYDILPNGERFVMVFTEGQTGAEEPAQPQIHIVLNWFEDLNERVPVP